MKKTKVLITGVAGFVGSNLADRLIKEGNYDIVGIDNLSAGVREQVPEGVKFYKLDIRDKSIYSIYENIDYVFHFAAKNCISDCQLDPVDTFDNNVNGTVNVFEAAKQNKVKKVIYAESSALYEGSDILPTPEWDIKPRTFYSISKACSMMISEGYINFSSLKFTALRYFNVYGQKQDYRRTIPPVFSSFIIKLLKGEQPIIFGDGEKRRDFIHIDDINDFHIQCMKDNRTDNETFNLGYGENYSINDVYKIITKILKTDIKPLYKPDLPGEAKENLADISKAEKLGWYPQIKLEKGLKTSIDYIRNEINKGNV